MPQPKIISIGYALPDYSYSQKAIFEAFGYPGHYWRLFRDSGISQRHFCVPLAELKSLSFQKQQERYLVQAVALSYKAMCLDDRSVKEIGCLVYGSCTGFAPGPTIPHYLGRILGFAPNTYYLNVSGQGCESGFPNLRRAYDFVSTTGKQALVVNCELCSLTYFPESDQPDPENDYELLRAHALFADAAATALVGFDSDWRHPQIVDMETYTNTDYLGDLGYVWRDGRLRVRMSKRVPKLAAEVCGVAVNTLLQRRGLKPNDIQHWVVHAAGNHVLDNIRDMLGLPEEKMALSRETLKLFGNCSSATVGLTGALLMKSGQAKPWDYAMVVSVGPGMSGGATLLLFL